MVGNMVGNIGGSMVGNMNYGMGGNMSMKNNSDIYDRSRNKQLVGDSYFINDGQKYDGWGLSGTSKDGVGYEFKDQKSEFVQDDEYQLVDSLKIYDGYQ